MADKEISNHDESHRVDIICLEVSKLVKAGEMRKAAMLLTKSLERYPENAKLRGYLKKLKLLVKQKKIKRLENEAVSLMQNGGEDQAQEKFRQILELDPTRTDLKHSLRQSRGESRTEYVEKEYKREKTKQSLIITISVSVLVIVGCSIPYVFNAKHIKDARNYIVSLNYYKAKSELDQCGWFMALGKTDLLEKVKSYELQSTEQAAALFDKEEYKEALSLLKSAQEVSANSDDYGLLVEEYNDAYTYQQAQIAKEKERIRKAKASAILAKRDCESAAINADRKNARQEAADICSQADDESESAIAYYDVEKYYKAQAAWTTAKGLYDRAGEVAQKTIALRNEADEAKKHCKNCMTAAYAANGQVEAKEDYDRGGSLAKEAESLYAQNAYSNAIEKWQQAAELFDAAKAIAFESPSFKNAILITRKWSRLEAGMSEKEVRGLLKSPHCTQVCSDKSTWYYQYKPKLIESGGGRVRVEEAKCGFVKFRTISVGELEARLEKKFQKTLEKIKSSFARSNDALRGRENELGRNTGTYRRPERTKRNPNPRSNDELKFTERHQRKLDKMYKSHEKRIRLLREEIDPRKPSYIVSEWSKPDMDNISGLVNKSNPNDNIKVKPDKGWQFPINWKKLKLNIKDKQVYGVLGQPDEKGNQGGKLVYNYGGMEGFGKIVLGNRSDGSVRLDYWKEPFWDDVRENMSAPADQDEEISKATGS